MLKEDYVSFEVAKLLKEKGFHELVNYSYDANGKTGYSTSYDWNQSDDCCSCITQALAMKWLREVHNIFIEISASIDLNGNYHFSYTILDKECKYVRRGYTDFDWKYEEAVEATLKYSLENLI